MLIDGTTEKAAKTWNSQQAQIQAFTAIAERAEAGGLF
jgi:hypothetical protein